MLLIRCERCHTAVWVRRERSEAITCSHCDQQYELPATLRGRTMDELHRQALGLAKELNVDFPSATSMAFGILRLPQVQDFLSGGGEQEAQGQQPEAESSVGSGGECKFDEAFRPAVEAGKLTPLTALHRGDRGSYAAQLVERHGISLEDALRVADNEESLLAVLRRRPAATPRKLITPRHARIGVGIAVALIAVAWFSTWRVEQGIREEADALLAHEAERAALEQNERAEQARMAARPAPTPPPLPELFFDPQGRVTRISAPRPEAVLQAYCRRPEFQPVALAEGMMPDKNLWLGVYADDTHPDRTLAIVIRKERKGGQWVAGDGQNEIQVLTPQPERLGKRRDLGSTPFAINAAESR